MYKPLIAVLSLGFLFLSPNARAEKTTLHLCNENTDRKIYAAYLKQAGGGAGWQSVGWFGVDSGKCRDVEMGTYTGKVFLYADDEYHQTNWGEGETRFCVNQTNAFSINNADTVACTDATLKKVKSDEYTLVSGMNNVSFHPNFTQLKYCNKNTDYPLYASFAKKTESGWQSKGWFLVDKNQCMTTTVGKYTGEVRTYAEYNGGEVSYGKGPNQYCVNKTNAFLNENADDATKCTGDAFKMVMVDSNTVQTGVNEVTFEPVTLKTLLQICNHTKDKNIQSSYGLIGADSKYSNTGWLRLAPGACQDLDMGSYVGKAYLYGEANNGDDYWGLGPVNLCVNKTEDFAFADGGNAATCSSDIKFKMVPTTEFNLKQGKNAFSFEP